LAAQPKLKKIGADFPVKPVARDESFGGGQQYGILGTVHQQSQENKRVGNGDLRAEAGYANRDS